MLAMSPTAWAGCGVKSHAVTTRFARTFGATPKLELTHYDVLEVSRTASPKEIREAYLKLSKSHHPDKRGSDSTVFLRVSAAYEVLSKPKSREIYDLGLPSIRNIHESSHGVWSNKGPGINTREFRAMSFEERVEAMGFPPTDPNYYNARVKQGRNLTAAVCVLVIVVGFLSRWAIAHSSFRYMRAKEEQQRIKRAVGGSAADDSRPSEDLVWIKKVS